MCSLHTFSMTIGPLPNCLVYYWVAETYAGLPSPVVLHFLARSKDQQDGAFLSKGPIKAVEAALMVCKPLAVICYGT